jgi:maleylpyruvate isomerase
VTQRLLGSTIALTTRDWQVLTHLNGWTRAHIAAHLARHAEALTDMALEIARTHEPIAWRSAQSDADLNAQAGGDALALQEALDESSAALMRAFELMDEAAWATTVRSSQGPLPASALVLDRLNEVALHHVDLLLGYDFTDIEPALVHRLLKWNLFRETPRFSEVELTVVTDDGLTAVVGHGTPVTVRGNEPTLLGWLTGRKDPSAVLGGEQINLGGPV